MCKLTSSAKVGIPSRHILFRVKLQFDTLKASSSMNTSPLANQRILVTRPAEQAEPLCQQLEHLGAIVLRLPTIAIQAISSNCHWQDYALAIFISRNAVEFANLKDLQGVQIAAVGQATQAALQQHGFDALCAPSPYNSEALLTMDALHTVGCKRVVIVRGEGGRELLAQTLQERGARVDYCDVYRRIQPSLPTWAEDFEQPDTAIITSVTGLENLQQMLGHCGWLLDLNLLVISQRIAEVARELGFRGKIFIADRASDEGLIDALLMDLDR